MPPAIEVDTNGTMLSIADEIKAKCPGYGFMVLVFSFGKEENTAHYVSNTNREDMIRVLREKADVLKYSLDIKNIGLAC